MSKQFEQFELLYKQIFTTSNEVKKMIDAEDYESVLMLEKHKTQLVSKVLLVKKTVELTEEENSVIEDLKTQILKQEKENLDKMKILRDKISVELQKENSKEKIINKYEQIEYEKGTICDYTSD